MSEAPVQKRVVRPIQDQILVRRDSPKDKIGSLYVPTEELVWPTMGTVVAVGPGKFDAETGERLSDDLGLKPGDRVIFKNQPASALHPDHREDDVHGENGLIMIDAENVLFQVLDETPGPLEVVTPYDTEV